MQRYPVDYPAFEGKDLSSFGLLEEMVFNDEVITSIQKENLPNGLLVYPNSTFGNVIIETPYLFQNTPFALELYSVDGQKVFTKEFSVTEERIVLSGNDLKNGLNLLMFKNRENRIVVKVIKR
ncbi:T9SS type A sorting domain-containing protein [Roseivirga pacifica]|uniref:T9SS type A sorting domain-containing protein n=1 Tax=Roseivirga pacifica TaxID=1267423 RepID=UPI00209612E4|nr:T9SS type A sorting domain-containing protein [Roseivirga pacifica]